MKILFLADLHWAASGMPDHSKQIQPLIEHEHVDAIVICGDICHPENADVVLSWIRKIVGDVPVAICLGNHDFWVGQKSAWKYDFDGVIEEFWQPACAAFGIGLLDRDNLVLDGITVVGGYGHYDFGHAVPNLRIEGWLVNEQDYQGGCISGLTGRWNDMVYMASRRSTKKEAKLQTKRIIERLDVAIRGGGRIVMAVHTPPFAELSTHAPSFFSAYNGNADLGGKLADRAAEIELLVCGHTHRIVEPALFGGIHCLNVGNDYGELYGVLYDAKSRIIEWVDLVRGKKGPESFRL